MKHVQESKQHKCVSENLNRLKEKVDILGRMLICFHAETKMRRLIPLSCLCGKQSAELLFLHFLVFECISANVELLL